LGKTKPPGLWGAGGLLKLGGVYLTRLTQQTAGPANKEDEYEKYEANVGEGSHKRVETF
jgi:hypothetical protein